MGILKLLVPRREEKNLAQTRISTVTERGVLVRALAAMTEGDRRCDTERFLDALSGDELGYIADFIGATSIDPDLKPGRSRDLMARCVERFESLRAGGRGCCHKMILLLEFLALSSTARSSQKTFFAAGGRA
jgi:hypothetical protein